LVRNGLFQILFLFLVAKVLNNCLKIVYEKSTAKSCNREICYFPHPFSSKQHQNLFTSEILPMLPEGRDEISPKKILKQKTALIYVLERHEKNFKNYKKFLANQKKMARIKFLRMRNCSKG